MSYKPFPIPPFSGGLNLRDQPDKLDPAQALDILDVSLFEHGAIRSRAGILTLTSGAASAFYDSLTAYYKTDGTKQILAGFGGDLNGINVSTGAVITTTSLPTASPHFFARFGGPTAQLVYAANGTDQLRTWDGASFATPSWTGTAPTGKFVAVTPWDNRLVNARRGGTTAGDNPSTVRFADPNLPNAWGANNYVDLLPGDGEEIKGVISWRELLFVFKESKFFIFYGTSADPSGNPVFQYRTVDTGVGMCSPLALAVDQSGVYFMDRRGIYRTTGGEPVLISGALGPFFYNQTTNFFLSNTLNHAQLGLPAMQSYRDQIWVAVPTGTQTYNDRILVYEVDAGTWTVYSIPAAAMATVRVGNQTEMVLARATGAKHLDRHSETYTTDNGVAIPARIKFAWNDYGITQEKVIRETKLWGEGKLRFGVATDFRTADAAEAIDFSSAADIWGDGVVGGNWSDGTDAADLWGAGAGLQGRLSRLGTVGTVFSVEVASTDATPWALKRGTHHMRGVRAPSVLRTT